MVLITLMSGWVSMNSPRDGSRVNPWTPVPVLNTSWESPPIKINQKPINKLIRLIDTNVAFCGFHFHYHAGASIHTITSCHHFIPRFKHIFSRWLISMVHCVNSKDLHTIPKGKNEKTFTFLSSLKKNWGERDIPFQWRHHSQCLKIHQVDQKQHSTYWHRKKTRLCCWPLPIQKVHFDYQIDNEPTFHAWMTPQT